MGSYLRHIPTFPKSCEIARNGSTYSEKSVIVDATLPRLLRPHHLHIDKYPLFLTPICVAFCSNAGQDTY